MKTYRAVLIAAVLLLLAGCGDAHLPYITSISVAPADATVASGSTQQFTAQGTFSDNATRDVSSYVTWSSSAPAVATIGDTGLASTFGVGTTTITASWSPVSGEVSGSTTLTVGPPVLVSIAVIDNTVTPGPNSVGTVQIADGTSHQFFAVGLYSDGGIRNITRSVNWSASPATIASVNTGGRATGIGVGSATVTATDPATSTSGSANLNVTGATISSIVILPVTPTIAPLTQLTMSAKGMFSDATTQDITLDAHWTSSNPAAATITTGGPPGIATGVAAGTTTIGATFGSVTGATTLTVSSATLSSITLTPASTAAAPIGMAVGSTLPLTATGTFSDSTTQNLTTIATWTVTPSDNSIASVDASGVVSGIATGSATVTATFGAVSQSAYINVENLTSIAITPANISIAQGTQTTFTATGTIADGTTQNISSSVSWTTSSPTVATISNIGTSAGSSFGAAAGTATINASLDNKAASAQLTVTGSMMISISLRPTISQSIAIGEIQQYQAIATFSDSTTQDITGQVAWSSSDPVVAVIDPAGPATGTGIGTTMITAVGKINWTGGERYARFDGALNRETAGTVRPFIFKVFPHDDEPLVNQGGKFMKLRAAFAMAVILTCSLAWSQEHPKYEIAVDYSWAHYDAVNYKFPNFNFSKAYNLNGGGGSFVYDFNRFFGLKAEFQGYKSGTETLTVPSGNVFVLGGATAPASGSLFTFLFGPQIGKRYGVFRPYMHALVGGTHTSLYHNAWSNLGMNQFGGFPSGNALAADAGVGLDIAIGPHLAIRPAEVSYLFTDFDNALSKNQNNIRYLGGVVFNLGGKPATQPTSSTSVSPTELFPWEGPVNASVQASNFNPKHTLKHDWKSTGGTVTPDGTAAKIDTANLAPGVYTVTSTISDPKVKRLAPVMSNATFTVKTPHPPVVACSADPTSVQVGQTVTISAQGNSPDRQQIKDHNFSSSAGSVREGETKPGTDPGSFTFTAALNTTGVQPGSVTVTANVNDIHGLTGSCNVTVNVQAPPPPPPPPVPTETLLGECEFNSVRRRARVDNQCKAQLDAVALRLQQEPDGKAIIVGYGEPREAIKGQDLAAYRAYNVKKYLSSGEGKQRIDPGRIEVRESSTTGQGRKAKLYFVPAGGQFRPTDNSVVDESKMPKNTLGIPRR